MRASRHGWILLAVLALIGCAAHQTEPVVTIVYHDLDLASSQDRHILQERVARAALALCEREAEQRQLGPSFNRFNPSWCLRPTRKSIEKQLPRRSSDVSEIARLRHFRGRGCPPPSGQIDAIAGSTAWRC